MQSCFFIDMDSQYLMVPKNWVTKLLVLKLLVLSTSLANELKVIKVESFKEESKVEEQDEDEYAAQLTFEEKLDRKLNELKTVQRLNLLAIEAHKVH